MISDRNISPQMENIHSNEDSAIARERAIAGKSEVKKIIIPETV